MINDREKENSTDLLSVCIITKNEEKNIERCLASIKPYGFEIIVVDTGSTDLTREIALRYTQHVYDFVWCDDFAAAKNFAISKASNPYVMLLDSDEYLQPFALEELYQLIRSHPKEVGRISCINILTRNGAREENREWINRIFARDKFCYRGRIHEQVTSVDNSRYDTYQTPVLMIHTGYDLTVEERKKKAERNKKLLEKELVLLKAEKDQEQIPYILYQLGKSSYMAEDYQTACYYFSNGLSYDLNPKLEYVIDMVETYGYALLNSGQAEYALSFENIYEEFGSNADFQFLMGLVYMNNARFQQAVEEFKKAVKHQECRNQGVNSFAAYYNIGVISQCLGRKEEAVSWYKKCGDYEPAVQRIKECGMY